MTKIEIEELQAVGSRNRDSIVEFTEEYSPKPTPRAIADNSSAAKTENLSKIAGQQYTTIPVQPASSGPLTNIRNVKPSPIVIVYVLLGVLISLSYMTSATSPNKSLSMFWLSGGEEQSEKVLKTISFNKGLILGFDISDNSPWVIYSHKKQSEPHFRLYAVNVETGVDKIEIVHHENTSVRYPRFSPSNNRLFYVKSGEEACEVRSIEFINGVSMLETDQSEADCGIGGGWTTPDISPDGETLFFSRSASLVEPYAIYKKNLKSGFERQITSPTSTGRGDYSLSISPNGNKLAIIRNKNWSHSEIVIFDIKSGNSETIASVPQLLFSVSWMNDYEVASNDGDKSIESIDISSKNKRTLYTGTDDIMFPLSIRGKLYGIKGDLLTSDVYEIDANAAIQEAKTIVDSQYADYFPRLADNTLYFVSGRSGEKQLWYQSGNTTKRYSEAVLPDRIDLMKYDSVSDAIYIFSRGELSKIAKESSPESVYLTTQNAHNPAISAGAEKLLYSVENNEHWSLVYRNLVTGTSQIIEGGFTPKFHNGNVYYTKFRTDGLWTLDGPTESLVIDDFTSLNSKNWNLKGDQIHYIEDNQLVIRSLLTGEILSQFTVEQGVRHFDCALEHPKCVFDKFDTGITEIVEIVNK